MRFGLCALLVLLAGASGPGALAHEVPSEVTVHAYLAPRGERLQLVLRVPLVALRDVEYPLRGSGAIDLARVEPVLRDAAMLWLAGEIEVDEGARRLGRPRLAAARVSLPSDRSFESFESALLHVTGAPLSPDTELHWNQSLLDVLFEFRIESEASRFSIRPALARLASRVVVSLRFVTPSGAVRAFRLDGDPGLVRLDPRWDQAALGFVELGIAHILGGADHLLFLLCLVIPFRRLGPLLLVVTGFTLAHSLTLIAAALGRAPGALWFPPLVETAIAASIVYMALENVVGPRLRRRWLIAFGFGLVHGFGFSFGLQEALQFAGTHLLTALVAFNVGVEVGQIAVLIVAVPALEMLFRRGIPERVGTILLSAFVAHSGWHWTLERFETLSAHPIAPPALDLAFAASATGWLALVALGAGLAWIAAAALGGWTQPAEDGEAATTASSSPRPPA